MRNIRAEIEELRRDVRCVRMAASLPSYTLLASVAATLVLVIVMTAAVFNMRAGVTGFVGLLVAIGAAFVACTTYRNLSQNVAITKRVLERMDARVGRLPYDINGNPEDC